MISTLFDPMGLGPIPRIPLVHSDVLKRHRCLRPTDDRFKAAACLLQSLWRQDQGYPVGDYLSLDGKRRTLGSRLPAAVGRTGAAFLSPQGSRLVRYGLTYMHRVPTIAARHSSLPSREWSKDGR